jgi:peroxiredoxin Q/BCP
MSNELKVGDKAPDFTLTDQAGRTVSLKNLKGRRIILYFYPKDDTPGCTKEASGFRDSSRSIENTNAVVLGVSMDDAASHQKFIEKYALPFTLLCDEEAKVAKAYKVYKQKNMYGKVYWGIERSTFLIDEAGKLRAIYRKVKVDGHVDEVISALKQ